MLFFWLLLELVIGSFLILHLLIGLKLLSRSGINVSEAIIHTLKLVDVILKGGVIWNSYLLVCWSLWFRHGVRCSYRRFSFTAWNSPFKPGKRTKIRTRATLGKSGEGNMLGNKLAEAPECLRADGVLSSVAKSVSILHTCKNGSSYALAKHREQEL